MGDSWADHLILKTTGLTRQEVYARQVAVGDILGRPILQLAQKIDQREQAVARALSAHRSSLEYIESNIQRRVSFNAQELTNAPGAHLETELTALEVLLFALAGLLETYKQTLS